jgi:hypothetical protein
MTRLSSDALVTDLCTLIRHAEAVGGVRVARVGEGRPGEQVTSLGGRLAQRTTE